MVARRFHKLRDDGDVFPDILLIDGGKGQLNKGLEAFDALGIEPPIVLSLAKKEELIYVAGRDEPLRLSRRRAPAPPRQPLAPRHRTRRRTPRTSRRPTPPRR